METVKQFGDNLRKIRVGKRLTQEALASLAGLHRTYIGSIERGEKNCTIKNVFKLADALEIDAGDLFIDVQ